MDDMAVDKVEVAKLPNGQNPNEVVRIYYFGKESVMRTEGISSLFGVKDIEIPSRFVTELPLMGALVGKILENISQRREEEKQFYYPEEFYFAGRVFLFKGKNDYYIELDEKENDFFAKYLPLDGDL